MKTYLAPYVLTLLLFSSNAAQAQKTAEKYPTENTKHFLMLASKAASENSGQIFFVPHKYNLVSDHVSLDGYAHIRQEGKLKRFPSFGTNHGSPWSYDTHIPLIVYGPGFVRSGIVSDRYVSQQDIVPTQASLIHGPLHKHMQGKVLSEAILPTPKKPAAILTISLDQTGHNFYSLHPDAWPQIKALQEAGTFYRQAYVDHLESATTVGHVAIGTGAWPKDSGLPSNYFWSEAIGSYNYGFKENGQPSPVWLKSPSFADIWDKSTQNKALVISYSYADRAAMGMAGHGSLYKGGDKDLVYFYDKKHDQLTTNTAFFTLPDYLKSYRAWPFLSDFTMSTGVWLGHQIPFYQEFTRPETGKKETSNFVMATPAFPRFDASHYLKVIQNEPIGSDDVTDLLYLNLKSNDACGHTFGHESEECRQVFQEIDTQVGKIVAALEKKLGRERLLVFITADHGSAPLAELSGGERLRDDAFVMELNRSFDRLENNLPIVHKVTASQVMLDEGELERNGYTLEHVRDFLRTYTVNNKPFFLHVWTRDEVQKQAGLR